MKLSANYKNYSVSHATLNPEHLIPAFTSFIFGDLKLSYDVVPYNVCILRLDVIHDRIDYDSDYSQEWAMEDLFDFLNTIAPEGTYFGSHLGDGSDFGFWEFEEE